LKAFVCLNPFHGQIFKKSNKKLAKILARFFTPTAATCAEKVIVTLDFEKIVKNRLKIAKSDYSIGPCFQANR
jgi:hypothetical protein